MDFSWQFAAQKLVRELGWSLFSPPLAHFGERDDDPLWQPLMDAEASYLLRSLEKNPKPLALHLEKLGDRRLGARFEAFWQFFLENHSFYEVLASNLQISNDGQTSGALDFLIQDHYQHKVIHLEIAVKFYLHLPHPDAANPLDQWIGPNPDDSLGTKIRHMRNHQLGLSRADGTSRQLKARGLPTPDLRIAIIRGYLFTRQGRTAVETAPPLLPDYLRGTWAYPKEWKPEGATRWVIVDREAWLDPSPPTKNGVSSNNVKALIHNTPLNRPVMLAGLQESSSETVRCFLIPENWPNRS